MNKSEATEKLVGQWIEAFRVGTHTDSAGNKKTWTIKHLNGTVNAMKSKIFPAVIGHPKNNDPAWGLFDGVKVEGDRLLVKLKSAVPEFALMVKNKMFPNRSIAFNPDLSIRHVGFLGAVPPAVEGMEGVQFDKDSKSVIIEFEAISPDKITNEDVKGITDTILSGIKDLFSREEIQGEAKNMTQEKEVIYTKEKMDSLIKAKEQEFSASIKEKDTEIASLKADADNTRLKAKKEDVSLFCAKMKKSEGKITAAQEEGLSEFMLSLDGDGELEFSKDKKESQLSYFKRLVESMPVQIPFGSDYQKSAQKLSAGTHLTEAVDEERLVLHEKAMAYHSQNKDISYGDAVEAVSVMVN